MRKLVSSITTLLIVCLILFVGGCATFNYNNKTYYSSEEALKAQTDRIKELHSKIGPTATKAGGSLLLVTPSYDTCVALGIQRRGVPSQEAIDYLGKYMMKELESVGDVIKRRQIFDTVETRSEKYPEIYAKKNTNKYDAVIFFIISGAKRNQWIVMATPDYKEVPVLFDRSIPAGSERLISWLDNIEKTLMESNYKP